MAINIVDTNQKWGSNLTGLQALGNASIIPPKELIIAGTLYLKRFSKSSKFIKQIKDFHSKKFSSKLYKIKLEKIKILDEEKFGKEEFKELKL